MGKAAPAAATRQPANGERFLQVFASARAELVQTLARMLGSQEDAQDVAQEAFLKCWRARDRIGEVRNLRSWIFRVGLNAALDLQRNVWRRRARPLPDQPPPARHRDPSPAEELLHAETLERLRAALTCLRPEEQAVFLLRQNSDLTYDQIAALRHTPVGTVKTQMRSALHKLRAALQEKTPAWP